MGWFWADTAPPAQVRTGPPPLDAEPPHSACPMRHKTVNALTPTSSSDNPQRPPPSSCPVPHDARITATTTPPSSCPVPHSQRQPPQEQPSGLLAKLNPLNHMPTSLPQTPAPHQTHTLPTSREPSTIPKGTAPGEGTWQYPSPQQMYHALLRKGYTDTDVTAVESMVSVHNFLNEGAWGEIVDWERRFAGGLGRGWKICSWGEENFEKATPLYPDEAEMEPRLVRFQGRPRDVTPKAAMLGVLGWVMPERFGTEPPFDRHDWYVSRSTGGETEVVRYVIDYYSGPPENGMPVFYLDVRPAATPRGSLERLCRWGGDVWWRGTGGPARYANKDNEDVD